MWLQKERRIFAAINKFFRAVCKAALQKVLTACKVEFYTAWPHYGAGITKTKINFW